MPRRFVKIVSEENGAIAQGRVTPENLRNHKDNLVTARTWITAGVPSLLVFLLCAHSGYSDYPGLGVVFKAIHANLTAVETRMRLGRLIENAMTKCKHLKTHTATNGKWMTVLTGNLLEREMLGQDFNKVYTVLVDKRGTARPCCRDMPSSTTRVASKAVTSVWNSRISGKMR